MSEIADKLRAVLKLRAQLEGDVHKLDTKIATSERRTKSLRKERDAAADRLAKIEDALRPLAELADGVVTTRGAIAAANGTSPNGATTSAATGLRRIDVIVAAIGKHGLDEWTQAQICAETGLAIGTVSPYIHTLLQANRIKRESRGCYRTVAGTITSGIPLAQGA